MRKKSEVLIDEELKQKIVDTLEEEMHLSVKLVNSSKEIKWNEEYNIPVYVDLEEYSNEKLNEILSDFSDDIYEAIDYEREGFSSLAMSMKTENDSELKVFVKITNRDESNDECLNIVLVY